LPGPDLCPQLPPAADGAAAAVLPDALPGVVGEGEGGRRGQDVEQELGRAVHVRENRPWLFYRREQRPCPPHALPYELRPAPSPPGPDEPRVVRPAPPAHCT